MNKVGKGFIITGIVIGASAITAAVAVPAILNNIKKKPEVEEVKDQKKVDEINSALKDTKFDTMSELVLYLSTEKSIDLEGLNASDNNQYVWDRDANVVFTMDEKGNAVAKPSGYTINSDKHKIWKMVNIPSQTNGKTETFIKNSEYGQYLRQSSSLPEVINFSSNIDTGFNPDLKVIYEKPESLSYVPTVVTYKSDLLINGTIGDIDHYGHAKTITVDAIPENSSYNEYGIVDGEIKVAEAKVVAKPLSAIAGILLTSDKSKVVLDKDEQTEEPALVGSIGKTSNVTKEIGTLVDDSKIPTEVKPEIVDKPIVADRYQSGLGTWTCPYVISTAQQLVNCQEDVNNYNGTKEWGFALANDIDMQGVTNFTGIGTQAKPFTGIFDGQEYTISNLTIAAGQTTGYKALFGYVKGTPIDGCTSSTIWNKTELKVNYDTCKESKFTTVVKNINIDNITNTEYGSSTLELKFIAGAVGRMDDAYISNINVNSGKVYGSKHCGGICGSMSGGVVINCTTGSNLEIKASIYNVGGILGSASGYDAENNTACDVISNCVNNASVTCETDIEQQGNVSGIVAIAGGSPWDPAEGGKKLGTVIDSCINNGKIWSHNIKDGYTSCASPSGISSDAHRVYVCANCVNNGEIFGGNEKTSKYASGLLSYTNCILYNCKNNGKVEAKAGYLAGLVANLGSEICENKFYNVSNNGSLKNHNTAGKTAQIVASDAASIELVGNHYANVDQLNNAISSNTAVSVVLTNVTVDDTSGILNISPSISSVVSNTKVCSGVALNGPSVSIDIPDTDIIVNDDHSSTYLYCYGKNSNVIVNQNGKLLACTVGGENAKLTNHGTIQSFSMTNRCVDATNESDGTIGNVGFDDGSRSQPGLSDKHFTNYGTIHTKDRQCHTISTISDNVKITIENYGTIKGENNWHLFLFYTNQNCVIKSYAGSVAEVTGASSNVYITHNTIICYSQDEKGAKPAAKVIDHGTEHKWTDYVWYIEHHNIP